MNRVYVLCFLTLMAVVLDILLFHTGSATAQQQSGFRVDRIHFGDPGRASGTAPVFGRVVGFDCVGGGDFPIQCFVASSVK